MNESQQPVTQQPQATQAPATASIQTSTPQTSDIPSWLNSFQDESLKSDPTLRRFNDVSDLAKSYVEARKKYGDPDRLLQIPKDGEDRTEFWERLGRPKTHDEYEFSYAEGVQGDPKYEGEYKKLLHEHGLSKQSVKDLSLKHSALEKKRMEEAMEAFHKEKLDGFADLQKRLGDKEAEFDAKGIATFNKLNERMGGKLKDALDKLNIADHPVMYELFGLIGMDTAPDMPPTDRNNNPPSKNMAEAQLDELKKDPNFIAKLNTGDVEANRKMTELYKIIYNK